MKSTKPLKEKISITLDGTIIEELQALAERDDRSLSSCINQILKKYLENLKNTDK